jgi:hypothetical protein
VDRRTHAVHRIGEGAIKLPPGADEFSAFVKSFFARELATLVLCGAAVRTHVSSGRQTPELLSSYSRIGAEHLILGELSLALIGN